ncbi:hypothetical protein Tco_1519921 [Tanacetum coccineum]
MLKTRQRARSSTGRDPGHLLSSEICRWRAQRVERGDAQAQGSRRQYADRSALHRGPDNGHGSPGDSGSGGGGDDEPGEDEDTDGSPRS